MKKLIYCSLLLLSVAACTPDKEDPKPLATAAFSASRTVVEVNEPVTFTDASQQAVRHTWDFGNGQTATDTAPSVRFAATGTYTVVLTAYNADNQATKTSQTIKVGKRYLREIKITALPFLTPTGAVWDGGGSGPDVFVQLKPAGSTPFSRTPAVSNVKPADLPLTFTADSELTPGEWTVVVVDEDSSSEDEMQRWTLPVAGPTDNRDAQGNGSYTLAGPAGVPASWNVTLSYETR